MPFFGLDHPDGCGGRLLDRLSELGIFRFYERVLDLGGGIGGPARWLARRRGCEVVSVTDRAEPARASRTLVGRSHLEAAVGVVIAPLERIPAAEGAFTHAWSVEAIAAERNKPAIFAELHRVVRPGGHVAIQEWVAARGGVSSDFDPVECYVEGLRAAGFVEARSAPVTELREPESTVAGIVRQRVEEILGESATDERRALEHAIDRLRERDAAIAEQRLDLVQVFAHKPT